MSRYSRVMWSEGMLLLPQHFQYQDEYHQYQLAQAVQRNTPFHWGIEQLEVDEDALAVGTLSLRRLKLVFPDGTLYDAPQQDVLPAARDLGEPVRESELKVYAALRHPLPYAMNYLDEGQEDKVPRRFRKRFQVLPDFHEGNMENEITGLGLNVVLLLEGDSLDGFSYCPLLQLTRGSTGNFALASGFIPPCLHLAASEPLLSLSRRLLGVLQAKSEALCAQRRERGSQIAEFGSSDVALFWLLNTVNRAHPQLAHLLKHPRLHPERLYLFLAELASGLLTFSLEAGLEDIPEYDHAQPAASLLPLDTLLRGLLNKVVPSQYVPIALERNKTSYYIGRLHDARLASADFYIAVHADMPGAQLLELVPRAFKVGSPEDIEVVVNAAMPGASLVHASRLPAAIPVRLDNHYFAIEPHGAVFQRMMQAQAVAFYVPSAFTNLKLELMAVLK